MFQIGPYITLHTVTSFENSPKDFQCDQTVRNFPNAFSSSGSQMDGLPHYTFILCTSRKEGAITYVVALLFFTSVNTNNFNCKLGTGRTLVLTVSARLTL
jgi:hypothetical protein